MAKKRTKANGEGTIWENPKTKRLVGQYVDKSTGKRRSVSQGKKESKTDFKERFAKILLTSKEGIITNDNITLENIIEEHIEYKYKNNDVSDTGYLRNKNSLMELQKKCNKLITTPIQKITLQLLKNELPSLACYAQSVIDKCWLLLKKGFKIAYSRHIIIFNLIDSEEIKKPKSNKQTKTVEALTIEQQKQIIKIFQSSDNIYNYILLLQLYTGLRIGEVLALKKTDINFKENKLTIKRTLTRTLNDSYTLGKTTKTKNGVREIPITELIKPIIDKFYNNALQNIDNLLFYDYKNNTIIKPYEINAYLYRINKKYNIATSLHTHMLRHSYATRCIESGMSVKVLQQLLGHSNIQVTLNVYTQVFEKYKQEENDKYLNYIKSIFQ